jgi:two-component system, NtrC family, nitrogen regulation sensor histidine kinase NtrY
LIRKIHIRIWFISALVALVFGILSEYLFSHTFEEKLDVAEISSVVQQQRTQIRGLIDVAVQNIKEEGTDKFIREAFNEYPSKLAGTGFYLFAFKNSNLKFWSDNSFIVNNWHLTNDSSQPIAFINNKWVIIERKKVSDIYLVGIVFIKKEFRIENQFLKNEFNPVFKIPDDFNISIKLQKGAYQISDEKGKYLFSLIPPHSYQLSESHGWLPTLFYIFCLILLLFGFSYGMRSVSLQRKNSSLLIIVLTTIAIRAVMMYFKFPHVLYSTGYFSPDAYASSFILPSFGDVIIDSILLFFLVVLIYREYTTLLDSRSINGTKKYLFPWISISILFSIINVLVIRSLILDSSISFEIYNILDIDYKSVVSFIILTLLIASQFFVFDKTILVLRHWYSLKLVLVIFILPEVIFFLFSFFFLEWKEWFSPVFIVLSFSILSYFRYAGKKIGFAHFILLLFVTTFYVTAFTLHYNEVKSLNKRKVIAVGLSNERDLVAEMLLADLQKKISEDSLLTELVTKPLDKRQEIFHYLRDNYFLGFWSKYDVQTTVCTSFDDLKIIETGESYNCFDYFKHDADQKGIEIPNTNFYFIDNDDGRICYLGIVSFKAKGVDSIETKLFIELNSRLLSQELGYPDLLLDKKVIDANLANKYSYAKYRNNKLLTRNGSFEYRLSLNMYKIPQKEFYITKFDGYEHLFYNSDKNTTIVLSVQTPDIYDIIIAFSYTLVLLFVLFIIYFLFRNFPKRKLNLSLNIRSRILVSFITILVLSFLIIGSGTVYYIISRYEKKNNENIAEKMQSILVELNNKIGQEKELVPEQSEFLTSLLIKLSNVFYEDINLYDYQGKLIATSRTEVFNKGFVGNMMNPVAFYNISYLRKPEYVMEENIGNLTYQSAYVPYYNTNGKVLAYLNLPYFTRQNTLTREISSFAIALINIYLILILLAVSITIFIANGLTRPLVLLQKKFREIDLGKKNEPIVYKRMDEIGTLVNEYNRMLVELSKSAEILTKSERETAWREMAKQIAHEIKNPLTPMKLSVQHLLRSYKENAPGWEKQVDKMSQTIIDQIDNLSVIASEFSNFARLPLPNVEKINVVEKVRSIVDLYVQQTNIEVVFDSHGNDELYVLADKEHVIRILTNLIKNAFQAIPQERVGKVLIETLNYSTMVIIKVTDNGIGIPEEIQHKLFVPNFTTKSSGMGLGLTMVKNMVEGMGGEIRYITKPEEGTTFFIELPRIE